MSLRNITFPNISNEILRNLKNIASPNGKYSILAIFNKGRNRSLNNFPSGASTSTASDLNGSYINGRPIQYHDFSNSRRVFDVTSIWPTIGEVRISLGHHAMEYSPNGFISFVVVKDMDEENVR
jgi:hypothetical protein